MPNVIWEAWQDLKDWLKGLLNWEQPGPAGQTRQGQEELTTDLDKEISEKVAKEVARQVSRLSSKDVVGGEPAEKRPRKTIKIKTDYVPNIINTRSDGEEIQTNIEDIKAVEEESSGIDSSLKAFKEISGKDRRKD